MSVRSRLIMRLGSLRQIILRGRMVLAIVSLSQAQLACVLVVALLAQRMASPAHVQVVHRHARGQSWRHTSGQFGSAPALFGLGRRRRY